MHENGKVGEVRSVPHMQMVCACGVREVAISHILHAVFHGMDCHCACVYVFVGRKSIAVTTNKTLMWAIYYYS